MNEMKRIGIISDTHGILREEVVDILRCCDHIIHAGDIGSPKIVEELKKIAPLYIVKGNNDTDDWARNMPTTCEFMIEGLKFYLIHDRKEAKDFFLKKGIDVMIFGHSHRYYNQVREGIHYINPGSCGKKRFNLALTMVTIEVVNEEIRKVEEIHLMNEPKQKND
ncbi:MAG: metallophosphoesterase family protein [Cellulosilyticaceae bacterium]